jgi:hypothetical protein
VFFSAHGPPEDGNVLGEVGFVHYPIGPDPGEKLLFGLDLAGVLDQRQ